MTIAKLSEPLGRSRVSVGNIQCATPKMSWVNQPTKNRWKTTTRCAQRKVGKKWDCPSLQSSINQEASKAKKESRMAQREKVGMVFCHLLIETLPEGLFEGSFLSSSSFHEMTECGLERPN